MVAWKREEKMTTPNERHELHTDILKDQHDDEDHDDDRGFHDGDDDEEDEVVSHVEVEYVVGDVRLRVSGHTADPNVVALINSAHGTAQTLLQQRTMQRQLLLDIWAKVEPIIQQVSIQKGWIKETPAASPADSTADA